jgi:hypothetical protein
MFSARNETSCYKATFLKQLDQSCRDISPYLSMTMKAYNLKFNLSMTQEFEFQLQSRTGFLNLWNVQ